ncbi:GDP-L-fucose synthase family protein [Rhodohalobacter sp. 614A]|uniref:GDP-L-fucose synthase family protein n=1 Tax=Rhodohalobacter sp. 614A TaxID=2908649 RepID=UPI00351D8A62
MQKTDKIYVAGHRGMVGSAVLRKLTEEGFSNLVVRTSSELDLRKQEEVHSFISREKPKAVIIAAAKVGGILANDSYPYAFLHDNLIIEDNLIHASHENDVEKLIFLGSSCIYPKYADQPLKEDSVLTGPLEPTNQWYAIAKIAGVKLCEALRKEHGRDYVSLMPTNLYGPGDNFDLKTSHVLPAMIRKFHDAAEQGHEPVTLWGSGQPMREFLYVDDVADAVLFTLRNKMSDHLYNVGTGKDITILKLAQKIQKITGHKGEIIWDTGKPDGTPRKLMDVSKIEADGWVYKTELDDGIEKTYRWFKQNRERIREVRFG